MHVTFDLSEIEETMHQPSRKLLRLWWRQPAVGLVAFIVCIPFIQLLLSVQSMVHSKV